MIVGVLCTIVKSLHYNIKPHETKLEFSAI